MVYMEQMPTVLVTTKITIPCQRRNAIRRTRLQRIHDEQQDVNIYLVHAPAGYGKTTLVLDWAQIFQQKKMLLSWYTIEPSDNEKSIFAMYFTSALAKALPVDSGMQSLIQRLRRQTDVDLKWLMKSILNLLSGMNTYQVIFLDDYHEIINKEIHEALSYFLEYMPQCTKVVIVTRTTPPFPFARWQVRARLCEVDQEDLKFNTEEVFRFLTEGMKLNLPDDQVAYITARTEGWAAGLQLTGINLVEKADSQWHMKSFQGNQQVLLNYLMEEVYEDLPMPIQQFLLKTAIFPRFSARLCDVIFSQSIPAEKMINEIERRHLFLVALDDAYVWFRYHHLFSAFLQSKFDKEQPKRKLALHQLASQWFKEQQYYREAVQQAFLSEDWQFAAALVCDLGFYMIIHSEISVLYEWTAVFPEEVIRQNPLLCILQSWALVYRYQKQNRHRIEVRLQQAERVIKEMEDAAEAANLTEHLAVVRTFLAMAPEPDVDINDYLQTANQMLAPYPSGHPGQYSAHLTIAYAYLALQNINKAEVALLKARDSALNGQLYFGFVEATFHLARLKLICGDLQQARSLCVIGKTEVKSMLPNAEQLLPAIGSLDIALGCVELEENQIERGLQSIQNGLTLLGDSSNPFYLFVAFQALAKGSFFKGESKVSLQYLDQLSELWPDIAFYSRGMRIGFHLYQQGQLGDYERDALSWCAEMSQIFSSEKFFPGIGPLGATEIYYQSVLCWMYTKIALRQAADINSLHQKLKNQAVQQGIVYRQLELGLIAVFKNWVDEKRDDAVRELVQLASLPAAQGFQQIFNFGKPMINMISYLKSKSDISDIPRLLLELELSDGGRTHISGKFDQSSLIEPLSDRELEVMQWIGLGANNRLIAEKLFITVGTVKSHLSHIFRKLDVKNRTEAVARLRKLGMNL